MFESNFFFFTRGGCVSCLRVCLDARLLPQSYQYPNLSEGADRVGGQLRGDKECPFSGVTKSGRVWRKVPESDARSVSNTGTLLICIYIYISAVVIARPFCRLQHRPTLFQPRFRCLDPPRPSLLRMTPGQ